MQEEILLGVGYNLASAILGVGQNILSDKSRLESVGNLLQATCVQATECRLEYVGNIKYSRSNKNYKNYDKTLQPYVAFLRLEEYGIAAKIAMISATYIIQRSHIGSCAEKDLSVLDMASKGSIVERGEVFEVPWIIKVWSLTKS